MNEALVIRKAAKSDIDAITEIYNEAILTTTATFDTEPKSITDRLQWFNSHDERHPIFVAVYEGSVVGWSSITQWSERPAYSETSEISSYVKSEYRNKGIGRKLKIVIIEEAKKLQFHCLIARVAGESAVSLHLNRSFGFVEVGTLKEVGKKFGRRLDVHILQKILD
jgi:L-amino acid N-acyltransferase YncA